MFALNHLSTTCSEVDLTRFVPLTNSLASTTFLVGAWLNKMVAAAKVIGCAWVALSAVLCRDLQT
jgi:hypothetical protein